MCRVPGRPGCAAKNYFAELFVRHRAEKTDNIHYLVLEFRLHLPGLTWLYHLPTFGTYDRSASFFLSDVDADLNLLPFGRVEFPGGASPIPATYVRGPLPFRRVP